MTESAAPAFIVATEKGLFHEMRRRAPGKALIGAPGNEGCACNVCPHMRRNTLEKLYLCLRDLTPQIALPEPVRLGAKRALDRMFELGA